jgi:putative MATE family efflux protein
MLWSLPPFALTNAYVGVLRSVGDTKLPMVASVTAVLVNLVFNWILIFGKLGMPALGVQGAAIATAMSRYVEAAIILLFVHRRQERYAFAPGAYKTLRIPMELVRKIVIQGLPLMFNELMWSLGQTMLLQSYSIRGLDAVAAMNIANVVNNLFFIMLHTMGGTVGIVLGNLLGSGDFARAKSYCPKLMTLSAVLCGGMGALLFFTAPWIPMLYNTSAQVMTLSAGVMRVTGCMLPVMALTNCCYFTIRAGGRTGITILFDSVYSWTVFVPVAMLLSHKTALGLVSMFALVQGLEGIKAVIGLWLVKKGIWVRNIVSNV